MECKVSDLVKRGHDQAVELKSSCGAVDVRDVAQLISDLATQLDVQLARSNALAAENSESEKRMQQLIQVINNADNDYCMCGDAMKNHAHGGCGHPTGMFDYHYNQWLESGNKTPATDAFLAEVRASAVDEACLKISNAIVNCYQDEMVGLDEAATICGEFAAQIRKERR